MRKIIFSILLVILLTLTSFGAHKFYMSIYQIHFVPEKKMLQITSRIFIDDFTKALEKKYNKKIFLGTDKETADDILLMKKYLSENFSIKVNDRIQIMNFRSKEIDGDVLVCYFNCKEISKIKELQIHNSVLIDWEAEQQNITHITGLGTKKSCLFSNSSTDEVLKF